MSTKYLSSFINTFQGSLLQNGVSERFTPQSPARDVQAEELKQILLDAKEGIEVKNTTHEFYETLERITNELRGMTEHSTAFLSRVRKSDAPDYFNIIKNPMDLGTVLKKVKAQQYKDKGSFKADLDLIWDNCLLYNTLPNHPLRRSAMTLRSRANHLLEFVTDPIASTPAPQVIHSQSASRFDRPGSRLDALDASHIVISTANLLGEPKGAPHQDEQYHSHPAAEGQYSEGSLPLKREEREGSSVYDEDFQDIEEDEEDESIKTRKGLTSHKSQPGGGRNLELLKGLAAQSPSADASQHGDQALSIYPSGLDSQGESASRSPVDGSSLTPAPINTPSLDIPDVPGTYPGQGSALVARRAAGTTHTPRDRRLKTRTPSMPPLPSNTPFAERTALRRTPDMMGRFAELERASESEFPDLANRTKAIIASSSDETGLPALISATLLHDFITYPSDPSTSSGPSRLVPRSPPIPNEGADVEWWQTACSDSLLSNGVPDVPAVPCIRPKSSRSQGSSRSAAASHKINPCWTDLSNLKGIKRTHHKLAVLRRDAPGIQTDSELEDLPSSEDEDLDPEAGTVASNAKRKALLKLTSDGDAITSPVGHMALQMFCSTVLEHAGFDSVHRSALSTISNLLVQYLLSLGGAAAFHRDHRPGRAALGTILKSALRDVAANDTFPSMRNPLAALARYRDVEMPEHSHELASLRNRLDNTYDHELEEAQRHEPRLKLEKDVQELDCLAGEDEERATDPAECKSSYALLRILLEADRDHLSLEELEIPQETGFPLHLLYQSLLRQLFPSCCTDLSRPFDPPPPYVSLVPLSEAQTRSDAVEASIGLLQPFLQARSVSAYDLYDDDDLPLSVGADVRKSLATRPDVPYTTGRVVLGKRKREVAAPAQPAPAGVGLNLSVAAGPPTVNGIRPSQAIDKPKKLKSTV